MSEFHDDTCRVPNCRCTHTPPCDAGWIELTRTLVRRCPNCTPDRMSASSGQVRT